ncbi:hypothetical protein Tco_1259911, partial [Tanacetum coccineum]
KRDLLCEYLPVPSIGGRSVEDVLIGVDMMNEWL